MLKKIGFVGLGNMGGQMAQRLMAAGYEVHVWARREVVRQRFASVGAVSHDSAVGVAKSVDLLALNLTTTSDVVEVIFGDRLDLSSLFSSDKPVDEVAVSNTLPIGEKGVAAHLKPGTGVIDFGTTDATITQLIAARLRKSTISWLDCPVTGGVSGAQTGRLTVMVGGEPDVLGRVEPILRVVGERILHVGPVGAGQVSKAAIQLIMCSSVVAIAEALTYAQHFSLDLAQLVEVLQSSLAGSRVLDWVGPKMATGDTTTFIEARLHEKDIRMIHEAARMLPLNLPVLSIVADRLKTLIDQGYGMQDTSTILSVVADQAKP